MNVLDLMRSSFRLIQEMNPGQTPNTDDSTDGLLVLNSMLDAWGADPLMPYSIRRDEYAIAANTASITIGATGDLDGARPVRIVRAALITSPGAQECELELLDNDGYSRGLTGVYSDRAFPDATLYILPIQTVSVTLVLYTWVGFCAFTSLTQTVKFPPAYVDAIRYNLAVRLAPEWNRVLRGDVAKLAMDALTTIKSINAPAPVMQCNAAMRGFRARRLWDSQAGRFLNG